MWVIEGCEFDDIHKIIYTSNEKLNYVVNNKRTKSVALPSYYDDFNVV